jgi:hypothetical protein
LCYGKQTGGKKKEEELKKLFQSSDDLHILIMNVEALSTKKGKIFAAKFLSCHECYDGRR